MSLNLKRIAAGDYRTLDDSVQIFSDTSDSFNGKKYVKETIWRIKILGYELPMAEMTFNDAKTIAWNWLKEAGVRRIKEFK